MVGGGGVFLDVVVYSRVVDWGFIVSVVGLFVVLWIEDVDFGFVWYCKVVDLGVVVWVVGLFVIGVRYL